MKPIGRTRRAIAVAQPAQSGSRRPEIFLLPDDGLFGAVRCLRLRIALRRFAPRNDDTFRRHCEPAAAAEEQSRATAQLLV